MRRVCEGCPCLEKKHGKMFCFWYQSWVNNTGCGNDFKKKPRKTQDEMHDEAFGHIEEDLG